MRVREQVGTCLTVLAWAAAEAEADYGRAADGTVPPLPLLPVRVSASAAEQPIEASVHYTLAAERFLD